MRVPGRAGGLYSACDRLSRVVQLPQRMLAKASIRLLFSRCRTSENLPPLVAADTGSSPTPAPTASSQAPPPASALGAGIPGQQSIALRKTAELRRRFEEDYPTELLDAEVLPSSRLLALTSKMVADKEIRWLPWRFRLSAKAQDDNLMLRPKKLPRLGTQRPPPGRSPRP